MSDGAAVNRYTGVAIAFHWAIAILILANFPIAWTMGSKDVDRSTAFALYQLHKSLGLTVLLLSVGRLLWRILNPPPPLPSTMKNWERTLSQTVHVLFYVVMVGTPLLGWMMVSASPTGIPTLYFGLFQWPHIAPLADAALAAKKELHETLEEAHGLAAWVILALLGLHVAGALKHQFIDKENYLVRIAPGLFGKSTGPTQKPRGALLTFGGLAALLALTAGLGAVSSRPKAAAPDPAPTEQAAALEEQASAPAEDAAPAAPAAAPGAKAAEKTPPPIKSAAWSVESAASKIAFSGKHDGNRFNGAFERWTARITFDPANLAAAKAVVKIDLASVKTGSSYYDGTLPQADWFDVANTPQATFSSKTFRSLGGDKYEVDGDLSLHGITKPITLPFTLKIDGAKAVMDAKLSLKRLDYNLGANSDPQGDWVDDNVDLEIRVSARKPG